MQGQKHFTDKVVTRFLLSERVPRHNFYRRLRELLDWQCLYQQTRGLYSHTGQPSLDPVMFFKLALVGRLENISSDRHLVEHCALRLDILYFLGYEVDEKLPWHSTISRARQLYPAAVFEHLFDQVFAQCVTAGLVAGATQAIDSAPVKASASLESVRAKQPQSSPVLALVGQTPPNAPPSVALPAAPRHHLRRVATRHAKHQLAVGSLGGHHPKARLLSNKTHASATGPEARILVKPGKARALNYLCSLAVDTAKGVISHIQADLADSRGSVHLPGLVARMQARLTTNGLSLTEVVADAGYFNGFNYAFLEQRGIVPWIPVFGRYKAVVEGFTYEPALNAYRCPTGKLLPFRNYSTNLDGGWLKNYRAEYRDCQACALKPTCVPTATQKKLVRSPYDAAYQRAWQRQHSRAGQRMRRVRQGTVEPVFGHLLPYYGLRRVGTKGRAAAHETMLLTAIAYNLKKLLKHQPKRALSMALALLLENQRLSSRLCNNWLSNSHALFSYSLN
ncbi:MAG: IS1182 family transposase [Janthinobacterium lividum]